MDQEWWWQIVVLLKNKKTLIIPVWLYLTWIYFMTNLMCTSMSWWGEITHSILGCHKAPRSEPCFYRCGTTELHHHLDFCWVKLSCKDCYTFFVLHVQNLMTSLPAEIMVAQPQLCSIGIPGIVRFPLDSRRVPRQTLRATFSDGLCASVGLTWSQHTLFGPICSKYTHINRLFQFYHSHYCFLLFLIITFTFWTFG